MADIWKPCFHYVASVGDHKAKPLRERRCLVKGPHERTDFGRDLHQNGYGFKWVTGNKLDEIETF